MDGARRNRRFAESTAVFQPAYSHEPVRNGGAQRSAIEKVVTGAHARCRTEFRVLPKVQAHAAGPARRRFSRTAARSTGRTRRRSRSGRCCIEGVPVRLSRAGQPARDFQPAAFGALRLRDARALHPAARISSPDQARFCVYNSLLSEAAVLGFDYGYSLEFPEMLCIWEAQFGDFANGAQVIIDQFIVLRRIEVAAVERHRDAPAARLRGPGAGTLQRAARALPAALRARTTSRSAIPRRPAQYFHLLRRQMKRPFRKPLIVMTPKSLLRVRDSRSRRSRISREADFTKSCPARRSPIRARVERVILCSGKVYYDLLKYREASTASATRR